MILLLRLFPSDQKHLTRNCIKIADVIFIVPNVDSRGEKTFVVGGHRIKEFGTKQVEFREIALKEEGLQSVGIRIFSEKKNQNSIKVS